MKILICTDTFYPGVGGTEGACCGFANALVDAGNEVVLACPSYGKLKKDDSAFKFSVVRLPSIRLTKNDYATFVAVGAHMLRKKFGNFRPDIIHIETVSGMARIGLRLGKNWNVPVVMTIHTKFKEAFEDRLGEVITKFMIFDIVRKLRRAAKVITVVSNMKEDIKNYGFKGEVTVINNGAMFKKNPLTREEKVEKRKALGFGADEKILLFVGRMFSYKRVDFVLRSFAKAVENGLDAKLVLIGEGEDLDNLKKLSRKLGLQDRVIFTGVIRNREEIVSYYQISDLFVTASIFDTDPIVVVEAASCKVPSLVLENTGCSGRIKDGVNGFLAKNDIDDFASKMTEILSRDFSEVAKNALETVPTTWAQTAQQHLPIYEKLIEEKKKQEH